MGTPTSVGPSAQLLVPKSALTVLSFNASPRFTPAGTPTTLTVAVGGGSPPYSYSFVGLPPPCAGRNDSTLVCTSAQLGYYDVRVFVNDSAEGRVNASAELWIVTNLGPAPLILSFVASPNPVNVSRYLLFQVVAVNGTQPFVYLYTGLPTGCVSFNAQNLSCFPRAAGTFTVTVWVTDQNARLANRTVAVTVTGSGTGMQGSGGSPPLVVELAVSAVVAATALAAGMRVIRRRSRTR